MSLPTTTTSTSKVLYHQILPHFILRQFHFVSSDNLRQKIRNSWRTHNFPNEQLFVYDLAAGCLQPRPVPKVYSKLDAFKDVEDVEHVESKLNDFEDEAASVVQAIHDGLESGQVKISRARLSNLRKFLFIAHYRRRGVHLEAGVETKGPTSLLSGVDEWLQGLNYYLDTPHHEIIATGERLRERYENSRLSDMLRSRSYPDDEELEFRYAIQYEDLANNYVLGVWVAAEESEFVLSGDAFGLNEGFIDRDPCAHRLHVLTPRIAIILRRTCLHDPKSNQPFVLHSNLAAVPISPTLVRYAKKDMIDILEADPAHANLVVSAYRTTPEAEQDSFNFSFTRLSPEQTYAVNEVIMMTANLRYHGTIIFRQPSAMRKNLDLYMASPHTYLGGKQKLFRPLLSQLSAPEFQDKPQPDQICSSSPRQVDDESNAGFQLRLLFSFMIEDHITFPSAYTRAIFTFHMATATPSSNPISRKLLEIQNLAVDKLRSFLDPPSPEDLQDNSNCGLVPSLAKEESELFFSLIGARLEQAGIDIRRSNNFSETVIIEAAIIGVTYWLAEERPDVLRDVLSEWLRIWA